MERIKSTMKSREELVLALQGTSLFGDLPQDVQCFVADLSEVLRFTSGECIVEKSTKSDAFFLLLEGQASVLLDEHNEVATLGPLDGFGEMGLLLEMPRVANKKVYALLRPKRLTFRPGFFPSPRPVRPIVLFFMTCLRRLLRDIARSPWQGGQHC